VLRGPSLLRIDYLVRLERAKRAWARVLRRDRGPTLSLRRGTQARHRRSGAGELIGV
jgi:hypothetical protein